MNGLNTCHKIDPTNSLFFHMGRKVSLDANTFNRQCSHKQNLELVD